MHRPEWRLNLLLVAVVTSGLGFHAGWTFTPLLALFLWAYIGQADSRLVTRLRNWTAKSWIRSAAPLGALWGLFAVSVGLVEVWSLRPLLAVLVYLALPWALVHLHSRISRGREPRLSVPLLLAILCLWLPIELGLLPGLKLPSDRGVPVSHLLGLVAALYLFQIVARLEGMGYTFRLPGPDWSVAIVYFSVFAAVIGVPVAVSLHFITMDSRMKHPKGNPPPRSARNVAPAALYAWVLVCLVPWALAAPSSTPAGLSEQIDVTLQRHNLGRAFFGAKVVSLQRDEVLYVRNPSSFFMPASNMKLVTAIAAAEILGLDYRFRTLLATDGRITDGMLEGDLIVTGSGDPTIGGRLTSSDLEKLDEGDPFSTFRHWAEQLKSRGISRVTGDLVGDTTVFSGPEHGAGWAWDDFAWGYSAPVSGLQFNENTALLRIPAPIGPVFAPAVELSPPGAVQLVNLLTYAGEQDEPEVHAAVLTPGVIELRGKARTDRPSRYRLAIPAPPEYFLAMFRRVLAESGIAVEGQTRVVQDSGLTTEVRDTLFASDSPDLRYVLKVMLKVSQNLYAETLLKVVSPYRNGKTSQDGRDQVRQFLQGINIPEDGFVLADGSGLSRYNLLTPETLVTLLVHAYRAPYGSDLLECLPIGGVDGTLRERMQGSTAAGNTRAKTGTLIYVRCLSGYVQARDGEMLAFSLMLNHAPRQLADRPERVLDEIVRLLAEYGR